MNVFGTFFLLIHFFFAKKLNHPFPIYNVRGHMHPRIRECHEYNDTHALAPTYTRAQRTEN